MKKIILTVCIMLSAGLMYAQDVSADDTAPNQSVGLDERTQTILKAAYDEILLYFRRYKPVARIDGNVVYGEAKFGRYPVEIVITARNNTYDIVIESRVREAYIQKWEDNLRKNINGRLK
jgi:hypothetical protein